MNWSWSTTFLALPSKWWNRRCNFYRGVTGTESMRASNADSHRKNFVLSSSSPLKTSGLAWGKRCSWLTLAKASVICWVLRIISCAFFLKELFVRTNRKCIFTRNYVTRWKIDSFKWESPDWGEERLRHKKKNILCGCFVLFYGISSMGTLDFFRKRTEKI